MTHPVRGPPLSAPRFQITSASREYLEAQQRRVRTGRFAPHDQMMRMGEGPAQHPYGTRFVNGRTIEIVLDGKRMLSLFDTS